MVWSLWGHRGNFSFYFLSSCAFLYFYRKILSFCHNKLLIYIIHTQRFPPTPRRKCTNMITYWCCDSFMTCLFSLPGYSKFSAINTQHVIYIIQMCLENGCALECFPELMKTYLGTSLGFSTLSKYLWPQTVVSVHNITQNFCTFMPLKVRQNWYLHKIFVTT